MAGVGPLRVVEQRAPAGALRWSSSERQRELRWSSSERQRARVETAVPRLQVGGWSKGAATGRGTARGCGLPLGWRVAVLEEARHLSGGRAASASERVETTTSRAPENFRNTSPQLPGIRRIPGPGVSVADARIPCMATVFGEPEAHPVTALVARFHADLDELGDPRLWSMSEHRTGRDPGLGGRVAAPAHRARAPGRPPGRPPRPRRQPRRRRHRRLVGQRHPADQARREATPGAGATPLDHDHEPVRDAMAAGTRVRGAGGGDREGRRRAAGRAPPRGRSPPDRPAPPSTTRSRCAGSRTTSSRWSPPRSPKPTSSRPCERQEALAEEACRFTIADDGHGLCHGRFTLPSPGRGDAQAGGARRSTHPSTASHSGTPKGLGHAFCEYVTRYPIDRLPQAGGVDATIVVTMTLENLLGDSQAPAVLDTGDPITADQARKLACEAGIIPMVLGGKSKILDLGRSKRLYDLYQRIAIRHRDQHCTTLTAATGPPPSATSTTTSPGAGAARPTSPTDACCAPATTPTPTTRSTR